MAERDQQTPYLHLSLGNDAVKNRNWAILDSRLYDLARGVFANIPAGGDLSGYYPDPVIKDGALTPNKIALGGDPGEVLSINASGQLVWITPAASGPSGPAGGDLTGTYPNPSLSIIQSSQVRLASHGAFFSTATGASVAVNDPAHDAGYLNTTVSWSLDLQNAGADMAQIARRPSGAGTLYTPLFVVRSGGTVRVTTDPVNVMDLATKGYVDAHAGILDAPNDGTLYGRKSAAWFAVPTGGASLWTDDPTSQVLAPWTPARGIVIGPASPTTAYEGTLSYDADDHLRIATGSGWVDLMAAGGGGAPSGPAGGDLTGTYPNPTVLKAAGAFLSTGLLSIGATGGALQWGTRASKARWACGIPADVTTATYFSINTPYPFTSVDTASEPSWMLRFLNGAGANDQFAVLHAPAGATPALVSLLTLDNTGKLTVSADPTAPLDVATKQYVDAHAGGGGGAPTGPAGGDLTGSYPNPTVAQSSLTTFPVLNGMAAPVWNFAFPANAATLTIARPTVGIVKTRVTQATNENFYLTTNMDAGGNVIDDASQPSWGIQFANLGVDQFRVRRGAPGSVTWNNLFTVNATGTATVTTDPANPLDVSTKQYADGKLAKAGDTATGMIAFTGGVNFGSVGASPGTSLSKHLALFGSTYGFNIVGGAIQVVAGGTVINTFTATGMTGVIGATLPAVATFNPGITLGTATTKQRVRDGAGGLQLYTNSDGTTMDDTSKPTWNMNLSTTSDFLAVSRSPAGGSPAFLQLLKLDNTGQLTLPGSTSAAMILGSTLAKGRATWSNSAPWLAFTTNRDAFTGAQDDATKPSWQMVLRSDTDIFNLQHQPAGGAVTTPIAVDGATGKTTCTLADAIVSTAMLVPGASIRQAATPTNFAASFSVPNSATWTAVATSPTINVRANARVLIIAAYSAVGVFAASSTFYLGIGSDGGTANLQQQNWNIGVGVIIPSPYVCVTGPLTAGNHYFQMWMWAQGGTIAGSSAPGQMFVFELA